MQLKAGGHLAFPNVQGIPRSGGTLTLSLWSGGPDAAYQYKQGHGGGYAVRSGALSDGPVVANCSVAAGAISVSCPLEMKSDGGARGHDLFLVPLQSTRLGAATHVQDELGLVPAVDWFQVRVL